MRTSIIESVLYVRRSSIPTAMAYTSNNGIPLKSRSAAMQNTYQRARQEEVHSDGASEARGDQPLFQKASAPL